MQSFIVVSGIPGSGKSTVGRALADHLGWPFLDKDDFLDALFEQNSCSSREDRKSLSRKADALFESAARELEQAVLCSFWRHPDSESESGTPSAWLRRQEIRVLEVVCWCPPHVAAERFLRRSRHAGHQDAVWTEPALIAESEQVQSHLPLGLGQSFLYHTRDHLDLGELFRAARSWAAV